MLRSTIKTHHPSEDSLEGVARTSQHPHFPRATSIRPLRRPALRNIRKHHDGDECPAQAQRFPEPFLSTVVTMLQAPRQPPVRTAGARRSAVGKAMVTGRTTIETRSSFKRIADRHAARRLGDGLRNPELIAGSRSADRSAQAEEVIQPRRNLRDELGQGSPSPREHWPLATLSETVWLSRICSVSCCRAEQPCTPMLMSHPVAMAPTERPATPDPS